MIKKLIVFLVVVGVLGSGYVFATKSEDNMPIMRASGIEGRPDIRPLHNKDLVRIAGKYGDKRTLEGNVYFHTGIDYACYLDTPIHATGDGIVELARYVSGYGNLVIIKHNWVRKGKAYSAYTLYAHLVEFNVLKGTKVSKRDVIGFAGMTGRAQGVHVHYELRNANNRHIFNGRYQRQKGIEEGRIKSRK